MVEVSKVEVASAGSKAKDDLRPRIFDLNSGRPILLDSGASVSIWPVHMLRHLNLAPDPTRKLKAVNGETIETFGKWQIKIRPQGANRVYNHMFTVAAINEAIVGWDYLVNFRLDLAWLPNGKCQLVDHKSRHPIPLQMSAANTSILSLAPISFKKYAQGKSEEASKNEAKNLIPPQYQKLIDDHPGVLEVKVLRKPLHGIKHHIDTKNHPPCTAPCRPLMPGTEKERKAEKAWKQF